MGELFGSQLNVSAEMSNLMEVRFEFDSFYQWESLSFLLGILASVEQWSLSLNRHR